MKKTKCLKCLKEVPDKHIVSRDQRNRFYMTCVQCEARIETEERKAYGEARRKERQRDKEIRKQVREAVEREDRAENKAAVTQQIIREADAAQKAREELAVRELCRRSLLDFVLRFKSNYKAGWVHHLICKRLEQFLDDVVHERSPRLMLFMPPRHGKNCAHNTSILTPSGWTTHGELRPGDYVYHPSGKPVKVLDESPEVDVDIEVEFSNGQKIVAHAHHEWLVHDRRTYGAQQRIIETQDMLAEHWIGEKGVRGGRSRWQLPDVKPIRFDWKELPMDPYVLGVWLGDGTTGAPSITNSEEDAAIFRAAFEAAGFKCSGVYIHPGYGTHRSYFGRSGLTRMLYKTGVFEIKQVPEIFLRGSKEQRMQLLAGLVDTDGHVEPHTGRCRFVTTTPALKDAVFDLATTLGFRPYVMPTPATTSSSGIRGNHEVFTVGFQPTLDLPTRIPRKQVLKEALRRKVSVVNVRRVKPRPGKCIQVDSPDGLYVVGEQLIPTHNSELVSDKFPSWAIGKYPRLEVILSSYAATLAVSFSQANRDRLRDLIFQQIFPRCKLDPDKQGSELWRTTQAGGFLAAGVGGPVTGRGANIFIVDDPVKNYEEAESETVRESIKNWWRSTARTRLSPGGGVLIIQCMTGDTPVLMADGSEKRLDGVRAGDQVASYDQGQLVAQRVLNWAPQGRDSVFRITTSSGRMVRANARHPFLVDDQGELKWVRVRDLKLTHRIVTRKANGANGKGKSVASKDAKNPPNAEGFALRTTTNGSGRLDIARLLRAQILRLGSALSSSIGTASRWSSTTRFWLSKTISALFVECLLPKRKTLNTGSVCFASTTATTPEKYEGCSVTDAISLSGKTTAQRSLNLQQTIFETEKIVAIKPDGEEEVFDIQVENTENFIANGLVSHNTRWHDDDLSGFLIREFEEARRAGIPDEELEKFEVVSLPAIAEENEYVDKDWDLYYDHNRPANTVQVRRPGDALHPQRYGIKYLNITRRSMGQRMFGALYQQNPVPDSGDFFRAEDFRTYGLVPPHLGPRPVYFAWDLAISQRQSGDFTVGVAAMYDERGDLFILDMVRGRWRTGEITDRMVDLIARYPHNRVKLGVEQGQIWNAVQDDFWRKLRSRGLSISRDDTLRPMTDKRLRARPLQAWMQAGRVKFPSEQPWAEQAKAELLRFDAGVNDDVVDALAWLVRMLENEPVPDIGRLRRMRDKFYVDRDALLKGYMKQQDTLSKRFMAS